MTIVLFKFDLNQLVSMEPEMIVPTTVIGHVAYHCDHVVRNPDEKNNIKVVYKMYASRGTQDFKTT